MTITNTTAQTLARQLDRAEQWHRRHGDRVWVFCRMGAHPRYPVVIDPQKAERFARDGRHMLITRFDPTVQ